MGVGNIGKRVRPFSQDSGVWRSQQGRLKQGGNFNGGAVHTGRGAGLEHAETGVSVSYPSKAVKR